MTEAISNISNNFTWISLVNFLNIIFFALNFFYAKFFILSQENYKIEGLAGFAINIITLAIFAFMPFFQNTTFAFLICHIALRGSDIVLIFKNNRHKKIPNIEKRWLRFDFLYITILILFVIFSYLYEELSIWFSIAYFVLVIFESLFDFWINKQDYGLNEVVINQKAKKIKKG
jgi:hypothetical protein